MLKIGYVPLYLKLYDDIDPATREGFKHFVNFVKKELAKQAAVVTVPIITLPSEVKNMAELFKKEKIDAIVTLHLSYSPSLLIANMLAGFGKPVILLDTTIAGSFKEMSKDFVTQNHGIHGVMDLVSVLNSLGKNYKVIAGHYKDKNFLKKIEKIIRNLEKEECGNKVRNAVKAFKGQRAGITGRPFDMMGDFAVPFSALKNKFGTRVFKINPSDIYKKSVKIDSSRVNRIFTEETKQYLVKKKNEKALKNSIRVYCALKDILNEKGIEAYTMNFLDIKEFAVPFYAINKLMGEGFGYGGEGDVLTALLAKPLNILSRKAMFSEVFCPDWKNGNLLMAHMGEIDPRFAKEVEKGELVPTKALGNKYLSIYHRFEFEPIEVTLVNISKTKTGFKLVAAPADIKEAKLFKHVTMPHYVIKPKMELTAFLEKYGQAGGGHHIYVAEGDIMEELRQFSTALKMQFYEIN
ncbi:MAG: hypothetical protein V1752_00935 [Candidatus Firestonebacteria bacterium]